MPDLSTARRITDQVPKPKHKGEATVTHTVFKQTETEATVDWEHCGLASCARNRKCSWPQGCASARSE